MTLARRLMAGSLVIVTLLVAAIVLIAGGRLRDRLVDEKVDELRRDARAVASAWRPGVDADSLAHRLGEAFGYRVTLIDSAGVVAGDAEFTAAERVRLDNHLARPEVVAARDTGAGSARRRSASAGDEELYVALRHPLGYVRVSLSTRRLDAVVRRAQRDVLVSGLVALAGALLVASLFARTISRPVVELRDVARAIAAGDLTQRPPMAAPGEIGDLATTLHRMTEQLAARLAALEGDEHLMTAVLESLEEGVLALDERGTVIRMNDRARSILEMDRPLPFDRDLLPRDSVLRSAVSDALSGLPLAPTETVFAGRTLTVAARPLAGAGAVVTMLDLTVVRRLETVRRDFVANVSHELKTPLTAVRGYAETLLDAGVPAADRQRFALTIRDNAARMQRIVDDLLDLSRIEGGGWQPHVARVDVGACVREVFAALAPDAERKGIALSADIHPESLAVRADPTAFRQVLANLVENAVRYTTVGGVTLRARANADGTRVDIEDTGVGIPPEHLTRIFERFYRADAGRSRDRGGTGLGLAIVRHLVDAHGGRVEAASEVGRGTTISVVLPATDLPDES